jgi:AcrR family transcriptional regulator
MSAIADEPRRSRREERKEETRAELIAAAAHVFAHEGFAGASLEQIARHAGYTTGAIYWHFKDKDDLFLLLFEEKIRNRITDLRAIVDASSEAAAVLDAIVEDEARLLADRQWFLLYFEFVLYAARTPEFAERFASIRKQVIAERAEGIRAAIDKWGDSGAVDIERLVRAGHALTYGTALHNVVDRRPSAAADVAAGLRDLFTGAMRNSGRRPSGARDRGEPVRPARDKESHGTTTGQRRGP